jgi:3-phosphoshikimate 1-carboxyvinyltransferase
VSGIQRSSIQGDIGILDLLGRMGCDVQESSDGVRVRRDRPLQGIDVDMNGMPDMVPTLAVTALFAEGESRIRNVAHLRYKESDRLHAVAAELQKTGANVTLHADGIAIRPGDLHGAQLDTHDDHRLAMSFALIGLAIPGISVENPQCVRKSFPGFWGEFEKLERRG